MKRLLPLLLLALTALEAGTVRVKLYRKGVETIPLEAYVAGVLMGEASVFSSDAALDAMAIAARTWAVHYMGRHRTEGYDFCESTHCQDYRKLDGVSPKVLAAVERTEAELLWYEGRPAATHYGRHCGGTTAAGREIWPDLYAPYLRSIEDNVCLTRGRSEWTREVPGKLAITRRSRSGRVIGLTLNGAAIDPERFPSNLFDVSGSRASGYGSGHGVGLCQIGADERGKRGATAEAILATYYPGTRLGISATGLRWRKARGERVDVLATDESSLRQLTPLADRALSEAERITGFRAGIRPRVRTYPTIAIYRDATGDSGNVAASASGSLIRLQPLGLLRSQQVLNATVLHEMLHVLIEANASPSIPEWYREGLAQYLGGSARSPRVAALAKQYGRPALLDWLRTGLPAGAAQTRQNQSGPPVR